MTMLLFLHLLAIGIWIGVVGAEFAIEFDGMKDDTSLIRAAKMHYSTDIWIEIPAFTVVLVTGLLMLNESHFGGLFLYKIVFGILAIAFNLVCVYAVFKRRRYAINGDISGMKSVAPLMKIGSLVVPTFVVTFALGSYLVAQ